MQRASFTQQLFIEIAISSGLKAFFVNSRYLLIYALQPAYKGLFAAKLLKIVDDAI